MVTNQSSHRLLCGSLLHLPLVAVYLSPLGGGCYADRTNSSPADCGSYLHTTHLCECEESISVLILLLLFV